MNIELTEEEREFLYRICHRALTFSTINLKSKHPLIPSNENDQKKLEILARKLEI